MGNKPSRSPRSKGYRGQRIHRDFFGGRPQIDPTWRDVAPAAPLEPLQLIAAESTHRGCLTNGTLALHDAWEIALAWEEALANKVYLVTECEGPKSSIVESVAWIRFKTRLDDHADLSIARAAAVTWTKLASCPGYSNQQNPVFWRCVLSEYCKRLKLSYYESIHVDDSVGFFTQAGHVFPRFMLDGDTFANSEECVSGLRVFCGADDTAIDPDVQSKLDLLLSRLDPFVDESLTSRPVDVCLGHIPSDCLAKLCDTVPKVIDVITAKDPCGLLLKLPTFCLTQLNLSATVTCDEDIGKLCQLLQCAELTIGSLRLHVERGATLSASETAKMIGCLLGLPGTLGVARTTTIRLSSFTDAVLEAFLSALPYATRPHSFDFAAKNLDYHDLPALAYAMFHPDTPSSSWRALHLSQVKLSNESSKSMEAMMRGNNLEALILGEDPTSTVYCSARLVTGAVVKAEPSSSSETVTCERDVKTRVDVCGVESPNSLTEKTWVRVVVPAYGLAWVRTHDLADVLVRPPSRPSLHAFTIIRKYSFLKSGSDSESDSDSDYDRLENNGPLYLPRFLSTFGSSLRYLDLKYVGEIESSYTLGRILAQCPLVTTLALCHEGWFWRKPQLRELDLRIQRSHNRFAEPSREQLESAWSHLTALRVQADSGCKFIQSQPAITAVLAHARRLQYFHWHDSALKFPREHRQPCLYTQAHAWSSQLLNLLTWNNDDHLYVNDESRPTSAAALVSVRAFVGLSTGTPATVEHVRYCLSQMDRFVIAHIFTFVPNRRKRKITVDPKVEWLQATPEET